MFEDEFMTLFSRADLPLRTCLTESFHKVAVQKSIPAQIRQPILHINDNKGYVDGFVGELTYQKRLGKHFL